jgi:hypothetical protein
VSVGLFGPAQSRFANGRLMRRLTDTLLTCLTFQIQTSEFGEFHLYTNNLTLVFRPKAFSIAQPFN